MRPGRRASRNSAKGFLQCDEGSEVIRSPFFCEMRTDLRLEGDIFVGDFRSGAYGFFGHAAGLEIGVGGASAATIASRTGGTPTGACCGAIALAAEHAEIGSHDFEAGALLAFLILPLAGLNATLDKNQRAFLQVLLGDFGLLAPDHDLVPLGALLALAVLVLISFVGGYRKIRDGLPSAGETGFGIAPQAPNQNHFVD